MFCSSLHPFWLMASRRHARSLCLPSAAACRMHSVTPHQNQQQGEEVQTSYREVSRDWHEEPAFHVASPTCKPGRRALTAILSLPASPEHGEEALHPSSIRDERKHSHGTQNGRIKNICWLHGFKYLLASLCRFYQLMPEMNLVPAVSVVTWTAVL